MAAGRLLRIISTLERVYGVRRRPRAEPLSSLVRAILSQNTSDANAERAFAALRQRFPTWRALASAPTQSIAAAIRPSGLARIKAARIKGALAEIMRRRGRLSLAFLARWPLASARAFLTSIKGVGPKSAAVVLNFAFGKPAFPVDTHIFRVAKRLALVPQHFDRIRVQEQLERAVPDSKKFSFHINLIEHGRTLCTARKPNCGRCPLYRLCPFGQRLYHGPLNPARRVVSRWPGPGEIVA
ncbi:MAG: endonuclease III [Candidatus Micrarchaeia archaeon]